MVSLAQIEREIAEYEEGVESGIRAKELMRVCKRPIIKSSLSDAETKERDIDVARFHCDQCNYSAKRLEHLQKHEFTHECDAVKYRYPCKRCGKKFTSPSALTRHIKVTHDGVKSHPCKECGKKFADSSYLRRHMIVHSGEQPFECKVCGRRFGIKRNLIRHHRIHTGQKPYVCHLCTNICFTDYTSLRVHMLHHTGEMPHKCNKCEKKFRTSSDLKRHLTVHSDKKHRFCSICKKGFKQQGALKTHMKTHTGVKNFSCDICGKTFISKGGWKTHQQTHTGARPFKCNICNKNYACKFYLKSHMNIHTGENPYKCDKCDTSFNQASNLKRHLLTHTDVRKFKCKLCGIYLKYQNSLKYHKLAHRKGTIFPCEVCKVYFRGQRSYQDHVCKTKGVDAGKAGISRRRQQKYDDGDGVSDNESDDGHSSDGISNNDDGHSSDGISNDESEDGHSSDGISNDESDDGHSSDGVSNNESDDGHSSSHSGFQTQRVSPRQSGRKRKTVLPSLSDDEDENGDPKDTGDVPSQQSSGKQGLVLPTKDDNRNNNDADNDLHSSARSGAQGEAAPLRQNTRKGTTVTHSLHNDDEDDDENQDAALRTLQAKVTSSRHYGRKRAKVIPSLMDDDSDDDDDDDDTDDDDGVVEYDDDSDMDEDSAPCSLQTKIAPSRRSSRKRTTVLPSLKDDSSDVDEMNSADDTAESPREMMRNLSKSKIDQPRKGGLKLKVKVGNHISIANHTSEAPIVKTGKLGMNIPICNRDQKPKQREKSSHGQNTDHLIGKTENSKHTPKKEKADANLRRRKLPKGYLDPVVKLIRLEDLSRAPSRKRKSVKIATSFRRVDMIRPIYGRPIVERRKEEEPDRLATHDRYLVHSVVKLERMDEEVIVSEYGHHSNYVEFLDDATEHMEDMNGKGTCRVDNPVGTDCPDVFGDNLKGVSQDNLDGNPNANFKGDFLEVESQQKEPASVMQEIISRPTQQCEDLCVVNHPSGGPQETGPLVPENQGGNLNNCNSIELTHGKKTIPTPAESQPSFVATLEDSGCFEDVSSFISNDDDFGCVVVKLEYSCEDDAVLQQDFSKDSGDCVIIDPDDVTEDRKAEENSCIPVISEVRSMADSDMAFTAIARESSLPLTGGMTTEGAGS